MWGLMFPDGTSSQGVSDHLLHLVMTRQLRNMGGSTWPLRLPNSSRAMFLFTLFPRREACHVRCTSVPHPSPSPFVASSFLVQPYPFVSGGHQHALWLGFLGVVGLLWSLLQRACGREAGGRVTTNLRIQHGHCRAKPTR